MNLPLICAGLSVLALLIGAILTAIASQFQPVEPNDPPDYLFRGFQRRPLAMQLARKPEEVRRILGPYNRRNRTVMRQLQFVDLFFIAAYWLLFLAASVMLIQGGFWPLGVLSLVCATLAAAFDVRENWHILRIAGAPLDDEGAPRHIDRCRQSALIKWTLIFVLMLIMPVLFVHRGGFYWIAGGLLILTGASGLLSVLRLLTPHRFLPRWRDGWVEYAAGLIGPCLIALAVTFGVMGYGGR